MNSNADFPTEGKLYRLKAKSRFYHKKNGKSVTDLLQVGSVLMLIKTDFEDTLLLEDNSSTREKTYYYKFYYLNGLDYVFHYISRNVFNNTFEILEE